MEGGPATAGKATVRSFPGRFDTVIHLERRTVDKTPSITAHTERHGIWSAGIRSGHLVNPMPSIKLDPDPINFWKEYDRHFRTEASK